MNTREDDFIHGRYGLYPQENHEPTFRLLFLYQLQMFHSLTIGYVSLLI